VKKKGKKKQAKAVGAASQPVSTSPARAQPAPKRLMQNLLSAF
jgi:hypothetical protein